MSPLLSTSLTGKSINSDSVEGRLSDKRQKAEPVVMSPAKGSALCVDKARSGTHFTRCYVR